MMNSSKTEKLIAARKKLKEFQLNKKMQDDSSKVENELPNKTMTIRVRVNSSMQSSRLDGSKLPPPVHSLNVSSSSLNVDASNPISTILENVVDKRENVKVDDTLTWQDTENSEITETNVGEKMALQPISSVVSDVSIENENIIDDRSTVMDLNLKESNELAISCLEEQKQMVNRLYAQVCQYSNEVDELQASIAAKETEFEARLNEETYRLKEELQIHVQTMNVLIAEKAKLTSVLNQSEANVIRCQDEIEELSTKLKHVHIRCNELEHDLNSARKNAEDKQRIVEQMIENYDILNKKYLSLRKEKDDLNLEISELKQKLSVKNSELSNLQEDLREKMALLSLNELKIQQLTTTSQDLEVHENQSVTVLKKQLSEIVETLRIVKEENQETSRQYESYVQQLETQQEALRNELDNRKRLCEEVELREKSYIQRLSDLEQRLQREREAVEGLLPLRDQKNEIDRLMKNIDELTLEQERLHLIISEKDSDIEALRKELEELKLADVESVEVSKLAVALESEQLGASRAILQNQQLKQQLNEMHDAFVSLSNAKLDLTEQLQSERNIGRKLNAELNKVESEMELLKTHLKEKETCLKELEKEKLQNAQIADRICHYEAQSHYTHTLQEELRNALATIENLKKENEKLIRNDEKILVGAIEETDEEIKNVGGRNASTEVVTRSHGTMTEISHSTEPLQRLEQKFKQTMEKLAEITDEKQRLEHLVLQLQGETETIGEYITLYQKQRLILQQKAKERDEAIRHIIEQRNQQQEQLHKLKVLVSNLLKKKPDEIIDTVGSFTINHKGEDEQKMSHTSEGDEQNSGTSAISEIETTSQILDLLTEIKDCKDACILTPNFHPCPWCSGKLLTV